MGIKVELEIDQISLDEITRRNLVDYRAMLRKQLREHKAGLRHLHPEDVASTPDLINALTMVIWHYSPGKR